MKARIIQPLWSTDYSRSDELFAWELMQLDKCDPSLDIIVLPESADVPAQAKTREDFIVSTEKYHPILLSKAIETAKRCNAVVFFNSSSEGYKNTTFAIDRSGNVVGKYDKVHPVHSEIFERGRDGGYSFEFDEPYIIEIDGIRYAFLTCYDIYFSEQIEHIAKFKPDIIIFSVYQRGELSDIIKAQASLLAYRCNAFVLRSSYATGKERTGGCSMIVEPIGNIAKILTKEDGVISYTANIKLKCFRQNGFGGEYILNDEFVNNGLRPDIYK